LALETILIKNLDRNLNWEKELALALKDEKDFILDKIQNDQISLLKILLHIFYDISKVLPQDKDAFLDYLFKTDFKGNISADHVRFQPIYNHQQVEKKDLIKNLGQMCALAMLGLHQDS
jgi:hypothetical protein